MIALAFSSAWSLRHYFRCWKFKQSKLGGLDTSVNMSADAASAQVQLLMRQQRRSRNSAANQAAQFISRCQ